MKHFFTALSLSAPSVFAACNESFVLHGYNQQEGKVVPLVPSVEHPTILIENPGTFYYFTDTCCTYPGFKICPDNAESGAFTVTRGLCELTEDGCVTSPGWPGNNTDADGEYIDDKLGINEVCVFGGVTAARVVNFTTETDYDYVAFGDCTTGTEIELFQYYAETLDDCENMNFSATYEGNKAYTSNIGYNFVTGESLDLFKCRNITIVSESVQPDMDAGPNGTYSFSKWGCQEAWYSAPGCMEADLVNLTGVTAENLFNHSDAVWQRLIRGFVEDTEFYTHPRVPNVLSYNPNACTAEGEDDYYRTKCECLEGYCAYYECPAGSYAPQGALTCGTCTAIDNCNAVSCSTDSDQICEGCAAGYTGEGSDNCAEIPSGQTVVYVVTTEYTFNSAFTADDIPNAKQDVATAAGVGTSQVAMEIRAEAAADRKKRAEGDVIVDVIISFNDFATATATSEALTETPVTFTTVQAANSAVTDPVVGPYVAAGVAVETDDSSAPFVAGSLVVFILALF
jgi:hypothetical protein